MLTSMGRMLAVTEVCDVAVGRGFKIRYDVSLTPYPGHEGLNPGVGKLYGSQSVKQVFSSPGGSTCSR